MHLFGTAEKDWRACAQAGMFFCVALLPPSAVRPPRSPNRTQYEARCVWKNAVVKQQSVRSLPSKNRSFHSCGRCGCNRSCALGLILEVPAVTTRAVPQGLTCKHSAFCPHSVFMCFVWISEQTAITSLYSINWLVLYNRDGVCLLHGTFYILRSAHTVHLCVLCGSENKQRLFHCTALTGWFL